MPKLIPKNMGLFVTLFIIFVVGHLFSVFLISALLAGWNDVEFVGEILRILLYILIPLFFFGKSAGFLGIGIYPISALLWGLLLSYISVKLFNRFMERKISQ